MHPHAKARKGLVYIALLAPQRRNEAHKKFDNIAIPACMIYLASAQFAVLGTVHLAVRIMIVICEPYLNRTRNRTLNLNRTQKD